jgi:tetratricopeptide (TPR) repeat protein
MSKALMAAALLLVTAWMPAQQETAERQREKARPFYRTGWDHMRTESWPEAAKSFQQAIDTYQDFEDAYYGLGLASMKLKKYAEAIAAYSKCRDLYAALAGKEFTNRQDAQRYRQDRLTELDEAIRQSQSGPQSLASQERTRQLQEQRRQVQEYAQRGNSLTVGNSVPAFVYVGLGSAYFRTEHWSDAEREYKAAIAVDPKSGEAHNNLAVVYLQTGRYKEADDAVRAAERAGYKVHPQLKQDIKAKLK